MRKQRRSGRFLFLRRGEERDKERSSAKREVAPWNRGWCRPGWRRRADIQQIGRHFCRHKWRCVQKKVGRVWFTVWFCHFLTFTQTTKRLTEQSQRTKSSSACLYFMMVIYFFNCYLLKFYPESV